ncbi:hypothetical protein CIL05_05075 [Virgibacillus profundi]|uniref:Uncharacterized protein n=1 Tax=Virgibacillus profundi TaxID=2024555 RepID=A0A2A2IGI2_9BACI|nr:hypothetical protein [Virgibacillus profundi]PAV30478.1 hypothetical protein CIL05_05075 [Virgibacillus profundi]PXY54650.1 hypothetical protein CIT14_05160 [Virgibacillus profundi]
MSKVNETGKINNEHDVGYRSLLKAKQVFVQLLKSFIDKKWVKQIDESNIELVDKSFILRTFRRKKPILYII